MAQLRDAGHNLLVVDGGDLLFTGPVLDEATLERQKFNARALVDGFNRLGTVAVTIGESDLTAGLGFLQELAAGAQFPFVSVNLMGSDGRPVFDGYTVVERGGLKVALVGASSQMDPGDGYYFSEPLAALKAALATLNDQVDLVVLLFHGTAADQKRIERAMLPIDVILQSHLKGIARPLKGQSIPVALLGHDGKQLTMLTISVGRRGSPIIDVTDLERTITFVDRGLKRLRRNQPTGVPLEKIYADNGQILKRIAALRDRRDRAERDLAGAANRLQAGTLELGSSFRDDPELLQVVDKALLAVAALESATPGGL